MGKKEATSDRQAIALSIKLSSRAFDSVPRDLLFFIRSLLATTQMALDENFDYEIVDGEKEFKMAGAKHGEAVSKLETPYSNFQMNASFTSLSLVSFCK